MNDIEAGSGNIFQHRSVAHLYVCLEISSEDSGFAQCFVNPDGTHQYNNESDQTH